MPRVQIGVAQGTREQGQRPVANREVLRAMQRLEERMASMETGRHREPELEDESSEEEETAKEEVVEETAKAKVLRAVLGFVKKPKPNLSSYTGGMNSELIDWITEMDKFFE